MLFGALFIVACLFLLWYFIEFVHVRNLVYVVSARDQRRYLVRNLPDRQQAADLLAYVRALLTTLIARLRRAYPRDENVRRLERRYRRDEIQETPPSSKHTSYTVNKGENIVLCVRARDSDNRLVSVNTLVFVALHELAHVYSVSQGHTEEFWDAFRFLLAHAIKWNVYTHVDYSLYPEKYCGTVITDTPLQSSDVIKYISYDSEAVDFDSMPMPHPVETTRQPSS